MAALALALLVAPLLLGVAAGSQDWIEGWSSVVDSCADVSCVRGRVSLALDRALAMTSIPLADGVSLVRTATNTTDHDQPQDVLSKLGRLVSTSDINIELANANGGSFVNYSDGRGKKKKYFEYVYLAALVAAVIVPLKLQGLALIAGKALLIAKVALALAGSALLKKLSSGETHAHAHRRVDEDHPYLLAYRDHDRR